MTFRAVQVAEWMLARARKDGVCLTQMQLQKLAYIMHGWYLAVTGEPLFFDCIEATVFGPFVVAIHDRFRAFGSSGIVSNGFAHDFGQVANKVLESVWASYGRMTTIELTAITRKLDSPWCKTIHSGKNAISNIVIAGYYQELARNNCS
jgi:uncharacterized phage-associated protein